MKKKLGNAGTAVILIIIANFLVKFFGLFREVLVAKYYGTSAYTDAYIIANSIPTVLFTAISSATATTFIPAFARIENQRSIEQANRFTMHVIAALMAICACLTFIGEVFTRGLVWIFASGYKGEIQNITITFVRILFPSIFGLSLVNIFGTYLQHQEKYLPIVLVPIFSNIIVIMALILSNLFGDIYWFVWGTLVGLIAQCVFYLPWLYSGGLFKESFKGWLKDEELHKILPLLVPVLLGAGVNEINAIIDKSLVSGLETGSIAALNYSNKIVSLIISVVAGAVTTVQYPKLAKLANNSDQQQFNQSSMRTILSMLNLILPCTLLVILLRDDIVTFLFQRGSFDAESTLMTSRALLFYGLGVCGIGIREVMVRIFYCKEDTKTPMISGAICAIVNIILDLILIHVIGYLGAALATSISIYVSVIFLGHQLHVKKHFALKSIVRPFLKIMLSGTIGLIAALWTSDWLMQFSWSGLIYYLKDVCIAMIFVAVYFSALLFINHWNHFGIIKRQKQS